jgi:molybdopterin-synthase adenylyltransferase
MTQSRITMLGSQEKRLIDFLDAHPLGHERGAIVLFRRLCWSASEIDHSDRYLVVDVIPFENHWVTSSSPSHVAFELKHFRELFRRCNEEALVFGFAHNHPGGPTAFSDVDDANEETLLAAIKNRNGSQIHFVALLWSQGAWKARVRSGESPQSYEPARHVMVVDQPLRIHLNDPGTDNDELLARQAAAFGEAFVAQLRSLRVAVVGAGGTGSPVVTLLSRSGVGEIVIIDGDNLERSNLNRVRGARTSDVGKNKAKILREFVDSLELSVRVEAIDSYIDVNPVAIDALASCDVIFGCTDDQIGREVLNAALYAYAQVYIDVGLGGKVSQDSVGHPYLRYHFGRVSTILPETGECLFCQGVLKDTWIRHQYAMRENPDLSAEDARERYLEHGGEQAPGVGPFTSAVADYGAATLFDLVKPFRKFPAELRRDLFKIDFVRMELRSSEEKNDHDCVYCRQRAFLLMTEEYRLNRPSLGKRSAYV